MKLWIFISLWAFIDFVICFVHHRYKSKYAVGAMTYITFLKLILGINIKPKK